MSDLYKELFKLKRNAERGLIKAHRDLGAAYLANAVQREKDKDYIGAAEFYYDAGSAYRSSGEGPSNQFVKEADEGYRRCKDLLQNRFHVLKT